MNPSLKIGIAGLGTVGAGTVRMVQEHGADLANSAGRAIEIAAVSARDRKADRGVEIGAYAWVDDPLALAADPGIDVVVELIGGSDGVAKNLCEAAIRAGKHVVTANKALIAHHGTALAKAAEAQGLTLAFEAAVAGGIPIIKSLREGLAAAVEAQRRDRGGTGSCGRRRRGLASEAGSSATSGSIYRERAIGTSELAPVGCGRGDHARRGVRLRDELPLQHGVGDCDGDQHGGGHDPCG